VVTDWRSVPGNQNAFDRLRDLLRGRQVIAFVGAGASAGLYPLWGALIKELANQAVSRGATEADRNFWIKNVDRMPDAVVAGIKRALDPGSYAEILRDIFRPRPGPDGNYFTSLQSVLMGLPFKGYITTNFDPGLLEARYRLRPDSRPTGFGTWRDPDVVARWQNGEIFTEQPCPILFAHGIYERSDTIVLGIEEYRKAYRSGPFRRLFESIWKQQRIVFVGFSFSDPWIRTAANEGLFVDEHRAAPQHVALLSLRPEDEYTPEMRRVVSEQYGADVLFYPVLRAAEDRDDHSLLHSILSELAHPDGKKLVLGAQLPGDAATSAANEIKQCWAHESTEDENFTGRSHDLTRLDRLSSDSDVRVIAVTGMGGLGKTSLVGRWVKTRASSMGRPIKGVLFWSIYADRDVRSLFQAILRFATEHVGAPAPNSKLDSVTSALDVLRATPILLVIDGLELLQDVPVCSRLRRILERGIA
jgi:hypothetical protein